MTDQDADASESNDRTRRRYIAGVGAIAGTVLLAGCGGNGTETEGTPTETPMDGGGDTPTATDADTESPTETESEETETDETDTGTSTGGAMVRVAHMSPDAPNVDVYVDDEPALEDVPFGAVSDYLSLPANTYTVRITPAGDSETTVFEGDVTLEEEQAYTVAAIGEVSEGADQAFEPLVLEDDNEPADGDTARVRAVHASPDAPAVDITAGDGETVLFDGVEYGQSGYAEVPAGDYTLEIRADTEENDGDVAAEFDVSVEGGEVYTAFAAGYLTPDDEPAETAFDLVVVQDTESEE